LSNCLVWRLDLSGVSLNRIFEGRRSRILFPFGQPEIRAGRIPGEAVFIRVVGVKLFGDKIEDIGRFMAEIGRAVGNTPGDENELTPIEGDAHHQSFRR